MTEQLTSKQSFAQVQHEHISTLRDILRSFALFKATGCVSALEFAIRRLEGLPEHWVAADSDGRALYYDPPDEKDEEHLNTSWERLQAGRTIDISRSCPGFTAVHVLSPQEAAALLGELTELQRQVDARSAVETNGWPEIVVPPSHPMAGKPGFRVNVPLPDYDAPGINDDPMAAERAVYLQQPPKHDELCTCGHARASHGGEGCFMFACWCAGFTLNAPPP